MMVFKFLISLYWYHIVTSKYNLYILYLPFLTKDRLSSRHLSLYHIHSHILRKSVWWENNILKSQSNILLCNWPWSLQKNSSCLNIVFDERLTSFVWYAKSFWVVSPLLVSFHGFGFDDLYLTTYICYYISLHAIVSYFLIWLISMTHLIEY